MTDQPQNAPTDTPTTAVAETPAAPAPPPPPAVIVPPVVAAPPPAAVPPVVNVTHNVVVMQQKSGPGLLVRAVWFIFIGTWLSAVSIGVAYFLCVIIVGLPLGFAIFNRIPTILTLRPRTEIQSVEVRDGVTYISGGNVPQLPMWIRAIWFLFAGIWIGIPYVILAWVLCVLLVTLPFGLWMFNRLGAVMTLLRH